MPKKTIWSIASVVLAFLAYLVGRNSADRPERLVADKDEFGGIVAAPAKVLKTNEIVKRVEVPADLPSIYINAYNFFTNHLAADTKLATRENALRKLDSVTVTINLPEILTAESSVVRVSSFELKNQIELELRKNGIPVKDENLNFLVFTVNAIWDHEKITLTYDVEAKLTTRVVLERKDEVSPVPAVIWSEGYIAYSGRNVVEQGINKVVSNLVISFSNQYLSANPR